MKRGFTLIELLAVIVILAIIALIATPLILNVIEESKAKTFDIEATSIEQAAEYYLTSGLKIEDIPKYKEYYIPVTELRSNLKNIKEEMLNEHVIVKKTDNGISYYYTGRDKNPYLKNRTLKEAIESDSSHIVRNIKVNGVIVNKVIGTKSEKKNIKNWVWYSGQLWQVLETTDEYVKMITANSVTNIGYGLSSEWETSWVRKWLNEIDSESNQDGIYYNNLSRIDLLLDGKFCLDEPIEVTEENFLIEDEIRKKVTNFIPINKCSNIATDKVGLMTFEDYVYSLNGTDPILGALGNSYIDEEELSWTMTKYTEGGVTNRTWHTYYLNPGHIEHDWNMTDSHAKSVRPVIYMNAKVLIEDNNEGNYGTIQNPYRLIGEQKLANGDSLNSVTVGSYIYLSEENSPYTTLNERVNYNLNYNYDKTKVRYRVTGINSDGTIKVQRSDILRGLPSTIAIPNDFFVPVYYYDVGANNASCVSLDGIWYTGGCAGNNYFKPNDGSGSYAYTESENIGFFLNNATNSYYSWLSDSVKTNIVTTNWNLAVVALKKDYVEVLFNTDYTGEYPNRRNDGIVSTKIGLPTWGDMFVGNDLNISYWYINRWRNSTVYVSHVDHRGFADGTYASYWRGVRPVFNLKSSVKITGGEGTPKDPYTLSN